MVYAIVLHGTVREVHKDKGEALASLRRHRAEWQPAARDGIKLYKAQEITK